MNQFRASQAGSESRFQGPVKPLNHLITLGMKTGSLDPGVIEDRAYLQPNGGCELRTSVRG